LDAPSSPNCCHFASRNLGEGENRLIIVSMVGLIVGALLAQRFSIFVLLPTVLVAPLLTFLTDVAGGHKVVHGLLAALYIALALQIGFLAGVFGRRWVDFSPAERPTGEALLRRSRIR
jgi:hypothetical protein